MTRPGLGGIHHVKFAVSDLDRSLAFCGRALGAQRVAAWDHVHADGTRYAVILDVPGLGTHLELRLGPAQATAQHGFDPVTIAVQNRGVLTEWAAYLDAVSIKHSPVLAAIQAWLVIFDDPDGRRLRLYTLETHGPEIRLTRTPRGSPADPYSPLRRQLNQRGNHVRSDPEIWKSIDRFHSKNQFIL